MIEIELKKKQKELFNAIREYDIFCAYKLEDQFYYCTKNELKLLKQIYNTFDVKIKYRLFKDITIEYAIENQKDFIVSALEVSKILALYKKEEL
jgi:hypothetical protein